MKISDLMGKQKHLRISFLILITSLSYTFILNTVNFNSIKKENPLNIEQNSRSLIYNSTVYSIDNYWYLNQFKNLMKLGSFTVDPAKPFYEVRRTPVYPVFYGLHYWIFGEEGSFFYIRFTQAIMLALAAVALFWAAFNFTQDYKIALLSAALYGLFPPVVIAVCYTITESLSTELICFMLYFLSLCKIKGRNKDWFLAGLFFSLAVLCRPTVIFAGAACLFALISFGKFSLNYILTKGAYFAGAAGLLFIPWTVRNYIKSNGDIIFLEKYYGDPMDYGMPNIHCRYWISCWTNPADFASEAISNEMISNINSTNPVDRNEIVKKITDRVPSRAYIGNNKTVITDAFNNLYNYYHYKNQSESYNADSLESAATHSFLTLKANFIKASWKDYYIYTPLIMIKSVVFQSNSGTLAFLDHYEQSIIKKSIKVMLFFLSVACLISIFIIFLTGRRFREISIMTFIFSFLNMAVIIYTFRYFEVRYNYPLLPFQFITTAIVAVTLLKKVRKKAELNF